MIEYLLPSDWSELLSDELQKPYFDRLDNAVESAYFTKTVYPPRQNIFHALELCHLNDIKVVILGQDPYHEPGQAHGLSFSVPEICPMPGSLNHIFQEIGMEFGFNPFPTSPNLERWASQGVLLLNAILTVERGMAASHQSFGWQNFTDAVIQQINAHCNNVVFMLWGGSAIAKSNLIDRTRHYVLTSTHPSGLSWGKTAMRDKMRGYRIEVLPDGKLQYTTDIFDYNGSGRLRNDSFWGCMHFRATNNYLKSCGLKPIDWR